MNFTESFSFYLVGSQYHIIQEKRFQLLVLQLQEIVCILKLTYQFFWLMFYFGHCLEKFIGCWRFSICSIFSVIVVKKTVTGCSLGWAFCAGLFSWQSKIKSRKKSGHLDRKNKQHSRFHAANPVDFKVLFHATHSD